jgi:hypothetical protein
MVDLPTVGRFVGGTRYAPLTAAGLRALVSSVPACLELLKGDPAGWEIREVGDGNLRGRRRGDAMNIRGGSDATV